MRFREPDAVRSLIVGGLRAAIAGAGHRASTTVGDATLAAMQPRVYQMDRPSQGALRAAYAAQAPMHGFAEAPAARMESPSTNDETLPLGAAKAQLHGNYIGTDPTGAAANANGAGGVYVNDVGGALIGGPTAPERNVSMFSLAIMLLQPYARVIFQGCVSPVSGFLTSLGLPV